MIPYGYPIFEQKSSVIAEKVDISTSFHHSIIQSLKCVDWAQPYDFKSLYEKVSNIYDHFKANDEIIENIESEEEYKLRVYNKLKNSKRF